MMNGKLTNRCAASGAHLFARYVRTCCENRKGEVSMTDQDLLDGYVRRNDCVEEKPLRQLICLTFPDPIKECFSSDGNSKGNPADFIWPIIQVRTYWRHIHTGPKSGVISSRPENGCRTIRAKVLRKHPSVDRVYVVEVKGEKVLVIDLFDLKPTPEEFVFFHQRVICEVEEPTDYLRTVGLDGGENQFGRAEPPDSEEGGTAYETSPVGFGRRYDLVTGIHADGDSSKEAVKPGEKPAPGNGKFGYLFPIPLSSSQPAVRADGEVGEDHEVRVSDLKSNPANDAGQLKLLVEEDYLPSSSPADAGDKSRSGHNRPNPPVKPIEKMVMGDDHPNPYKV